MRHSRIVGIGLLLACCAPGQPPVTLHSPTAPPEASIPPAAAGDPLKMLPYFDDYSWRAFIAMVWPAAEGQRGMPDQNQTVASDGRPKVFETLKAAWEVFHADSTGKLDGSAPADWYHYDQKQYNACAADVRFGDLVLASFSKFSDMGQAGFGTLDPALCGGRCGPLVAQNKTFVHYLTGYNQKIFDQIQAQSLYLKNHPPATFQANALTVKSAWMEMKNIDAAHSARYYTREAWVRDPDGACSKKTMGLVGLHIVQKTLARPQWIWSTFEQVDNVPPLDPLGADGTFAFYKSGGPALPTYNPYPLVPSLTAPVIPYNVQRLRPIDPKTLATSLKYRQALHAVGSVWQYYQLVMTQFPIRAGQPGVDAAQPRNTFPGVGADARAFANVTMETFEQNDIGHSCMACHSSVGTKTDFVWSLYDRPSGDVFGTQMLSRLKTLLGQ